ncbi:MAG: hypothetical protein FJY17_07760 [Bacteroidetes bacterium]|nr:hypothetical protein [Bacteroidota bacterium]
MKKVMTIFGVIILASIILISCGGGTDPSKFPTSNLTYFDAENEVGGHSKLSDDKKEDIFNSKYENHWFTWSGEVVLADADDASINIDGIGIQDLQIYFADEKAGYNLKIGDQIKVRFVMTSMGGRFLPFGGEHAIIIP